MRLLEIVVELVKGKMQIRSGKLRGRVSRLEQPFQEIQHWLVSLFILGGLMLGGCSSEQVASQSSTDTSLNGGSPSAQVSSSATQTTSVTANQAGSPMNDLPVLEGKATVVMTVKGSPITIEVDGTDAQITAGNFVDLVQRGVYDGLMFHRVVREPQPFVVQGGDPQSKDPKFPQQRLGTGGFTDPKTGNQRYIPLEIEPEGADAPIYGKTLESAGAGAPKLKHTRGALAMARSQQPNSASSQFYIALAELPFLDGSYAVFGKVTQGMEVVDKIQQGDRIESAKVIQGAENLRDGGK